MNREKTLSQRKRDAVLEAAAEAFRSNGYQETSMDRVAEMAQVSKRTVYKHFPSKEDLFRAIAHELVLQQHYSLEADYRPKQRLRSQLIRIATQEVELFSSEEYLATSRVLLGEALRSPELVSKVFDGVPGNSGAIPRWVEAACADGRLKVKDQALAATQLLSMIKGVLFWPRALSMCPAIDRKERARVIAAAVDMFLHHYEVS